MDDIRSHYGEWALVAGAAEGIGAAFSEVLAGKNMNIIMVDFNEQAMKTLAGQLESSKGIKVVQLVLDLARSDAWEKILETAEQMDCRLMVYNAAYSKVRPFLDNSGADIDRFVDVNARSMIKLVHGFASRLKDGRTGGILLMSSLAGLLGPRYVAPYAATKAFTLTLAEALFPEFRELGIRITACCAGTTATPTYLSSQPKDHNQRLDVMNPMDVAEYAIANLGIKPVIIPGWKNRLNYFFLTRLMSRKMAAGTVSKYMLRLYPGLSK